MHTTSLFPMDCNMGLMRKGKLWEGGKITSCTCGPNSTAASTDPLQSELQCHCAVVIRARVAVFTEVARPPARGGGRSVRPVKQPDPLPDLATCQDEAAVRASNQRGSSAACAPMSPREARAQELK